MLRVAALSSLDLGDLPPECPAQGEVMLAAIIDGSGDPHPDGQREELRSNVIPLGGIGPAERVLLDWDLLADLPEESAVGIRFGYHYYPWTCAETGVVQWTIEPVDHGDFAFYPSDGIECATFLSEGPDHLPALAELDSLRVVFQIWSDCRGLEVEDCTGPESTNITPIFDNIRVGFLDEMVSAEDPSVPVGASARLEVISPNPTGARVTIRYTLPTSGAHALEIFDARGALVRRLTSGVNEPGQGMIMWDGLNGVGKPVAAGVYFVRLSGGGDYDTAKMTIAH